MTRDEAAFVQEVLRLLPVGSLIRIKYTPADGVRPEVERACKVLEMDPEMYLVEYTGSSMSPRNEVLMHGTCINRGDNHRSFNVSRLSKIKVLRRGPEA